MAYFLLQSSLGELCLFLSASLPVVYKGDDIIDDTAWWFPLHMPPKHALEVERELPTPGSSRRSLLSGTLSGTQMFESHT